MRKLILCLMFLTLPATAHASTASSTIINNVSTSSTNSDSQVTSHTDITVETDGKTIHYTSEEPNKSIRVESINGKSKIEVDGVEVSGSPISPTPKISPSETSDTFKNQDLGESFVQKILEQIIHPFKILFSILLPF